MLMLYAYLYGHIRKTMITRSMPECDVKGSLKCRFIKARESFTSVRWLEFSSRQRPGNKDGLALVVEFLHWGLKIEF